jgi:hypothetical protein
MNDLEKELGLALRREDPPEGFADRVLARVANEPRSEEAAPVLPFARRRSWIYAVAAAAAVLVFAFGAWRVATPSQSPVVGSAAPPYVESPKQPDTANPPPVVSAPPVVSSPRVTRVATKTPRVAPVRRAARPRNDPSVAEAERARDQLMLALRIASDQLGSARRLVLEESRQPGS